MGQTEYHFEATPCLRRWLDRAKRDRAIVLFDVDPDVREDGTLRINLDISFKGIPLRIKGFDGLSSDWYLGCGSAQIEIHSEGGEFLSHSPGSVLKTKIKTSKKHTWRASVSISPSAKWKTSKGEVEANLGTVAFERGSERLYDIYFLSQARTLAVVNEDQALRWRFDPLEGQDPARDFLFGNLYLWAECRNNGIVPSIEVVVRNSDVSLFNPKRQEATSKAQSLLMLFTIRREVKKLFSPDGYHVSFEQKCPEEAQGVTS